MKACDSPTCCDRWIEILQMLNGGQRLEAVREAARLLREDPPRGCRWARRAIARMQCEGLLDGEGKVIE